MGVNKREGIKKILINHGCKEHCLYGDDGEKQCGCCIIDFKRGDINKIMKSLNDKKLRVMYGDNVIEQLYKIVGIRHENL